MKPIKSFADYEAQHITLAALPAGDDAGLVKDLRFLSDEAKKNWMASDVFAKSLSVAADAIEAKDATIAQLRGEVERLKGKAMDEFNLGLAQAERADKAEAVILQIAQSKLAPARRIAEAYIREISTAPDLAGKPESDGPQVTEQKETR